MLKFLVEAFSGERCTVESCCESRSGVVDWNGRCPKLYGEEQNLLKESNPPPPAPCTYRSSYISKAGSTVRYDIFFVI